MSRFGQRAAVLLASLLALFGIAATAQARDLQLPIFVAPGLNSDLSPSVTAGAHPFEMMNLFEINRTPTGEELADGGHVGPVANLRDVGIDMPAGSVLDAAAFPQCTQEVFNARNCSSATQVGIAQLTLAGQPGSVSAPIYNMVPPPGQPAQFAYRVNLSSVYVNFHFRSGTDYGIAATESGLSEAFGILSSSLRIWGVPGDPGHDSFRYAGNGAPNPGPYPEPPPYRPLLSNPTSCEGPLVTTLTATNWQHLGEVTAAAPFEALAMGGCNQLDFTPTIEAKPTTNLADSPSGLTLGIHVAQTQDAEGLASANLRDAKIELPPGLTIDPSLANGLSVCSQGQIGYAGQSDARQLIRYDMPPKAFSGTFAVEYAGQSTAQIPATASRAQVAAAIETLPGLAGNVSLSGAPGGWIVSFTGALSGKPVKTLTGTVTEDPSQRVAITGEGGEFSLAFEGSSTPSLPFDASAPMVEAALRALPAIGGDNLFPGNVFVTDAGTRGDKHSLTVNFAEDLAGSQPPLTSTSTLTGAEAGVTVTPAPPPPPRLLSVAPIGGIAPGTAQFDEAPASCPETSKIGTVRMNAPAVIGHPLEGVLYLATPHKNPFGALIAFYVSVDDAQSGAVLKLPGLIEADPATGRLTATLAELPQMPFEDIQIELFKGSASPLRTGIACGAFSVASDITPWTAPASVVAHPTDDFAIEKGAGAGACAADEASAPNSPTLEAGTFEPTGGAYSPFALKLARADGTQGISRIDTTLPTGLLAKLAGVATCSDADLSAAALKSGNAEMASPSCPADSRVGGVDVGAGAGPTPYFAKGNVYLAGPRDGAPLSLAVVTPAVAGPFDLGTVVTRVALHVDPASTQVRAVSDQLPSILEGIPLDLRSIVLNLDRDRFTVNPTSCASETISGAATALTGQVAPLKEHFQVGECSKLGFKPKLTVSLKGSTRRRANPALTAVIKPREGDANLSEASIRLPKSEAIDNSHIKGACTQAQFATSQCPASTQYGSARVVSPLLDKPLEGPVYLRASSNPLPDLVVDLHGQIDVVLDGQISSKGGVRATFENLPDVPVKEMSLELKGGKSGLIKNSTNVCASGGRASALLAGQNGKSVNQSPVVAGGCKKSGKHAKRKPHGGGSK